MDLESIDRIVESLNLQVHPQLEGTPFEVSSNGLATAITCFGVALWTSEDDPRPYRNACDTCAGTGSLYTGGSTVKCKDCEGQGGVGGVEPEYVDLKDFLIKEVRSWADGLVEALGGDDLNREEEAERRGYDMAMDMLSERGHALLEMGIPYDECRGGSDATRNN